MFKKFLLKRRKLIKRLLEIFPGFLTWNFILFPYWGIIIIPKVVAYFILFFNIYWFFQSFLTAISASMSHLKIQASIIYDWLSDLKTFPDWKSVHHIVIVPTFKEPVRILQRTINSIARQDLPTKQISIVLAMEEREVKKERERKANLLKKTFAKTFANFFVTVHRLQPNEVAGKASNEKHAATWVKKELVDKRKMDINYFTVTSCDSDHKFHAKHFSCLSFKFLDNPKRFRRFWQPAVMFYNNIWEIPAITRVANTLSSIWNLALLSRKDKLLNCQNYSLSLKLLDEVGYWDADKIPEDWGIFFKSYYKKRGNLEVEPIFLPLYADAAQSESLFGTFKNQYEQLKRWAWGVSDEPWIIKNYFLTPGVPFWDKTLRVLHVLWSHLLWPVNWFLITIGLTLPTLLNPAFGRTALGHTVPKLSSFILTVALLFLVVMLLIDRIYKPQRPKTVAVWKKILTPFEFILMPIAGFFFNSLPALDAHTRLMLGKYIEYKVTEKV